MTSPPVDLHRTGSPLPFLSGTTPLPAAYNSSPRPWRTSPWLAVGHSRLTREQTCRIGGIAGGGNYPPIGPLLCPANGCEQSGFRGWSDLRPITGSQHGARQLYSCSREIDPIFMGIWQGEEGGGVVIIPPTTGTQLSIGVLVTTQNTK